ncbi:MAG: CcdB family protein [Rhizobiaceae bacterium]|nr:CcdB family protein [Rhizobiaceae bacterium]
MAKHEVFFNPEGNGYLLDVQTDLLDELDTRVVVPLIELAYAPPLARRLNPVFEIGGVEVVMVTQYLSPVPANILKVPVANLQNEFSQITAALDMVFQGF